MGIAAVSKSDLRAAALLAGESVVVGHALALARWVGARRLSVTAGQVLRKADLPEAGAALGVEVPSRLRTMADLPGLCRPWHMAVATGLLRIEDSRVTSGPVLERWPPGEADLLVGWLAGLRAVCLAQSRPRDEDAIRLLVIAVLTVLSEGAARADRLWQPVYATIEDLCRRYDKPCWELLSAADRYYDAETNTPIPWLLALLEEFGAVGGDVATPVINPLGRWAAQQLAIGLPSIADASLSPAEMVAEVAQFGDEEERGHVASDWRWLDVEFAAAELEDKGPDAALSGVWETMPGADLDSRLAAVRGTGHPEAAALAAAVAEFAASGAPRSIDQVAELKVGLVGFRSPVWRRVRLPVTASLGDLHVVIQLLFGWDGDHLHVFRAGKKQYSDVLMGLEGTRDEDLIRIQDVMALGSGTIRYTYDLGTCWEHEITLQSTMARDGGQDYPVCVAYQGDSPVEYWSEDDPVEPESFRQAEVNRRLAALSEAEL